ncbi:tRNA adenylyltransferase (CCA-adding enzyme) [Methanocella conradii HZ254]|uniref:CCA-adding enzyme n=1 Tax=Methanocella conradii (strain DSM 24694 / JCM 17849 / CGMCC 1.5162 / HZ254) TaxID=1041930 RepID=H8I9B4_METCZ|nr:CCA tRNA nucleotidyltransferase [Methanocella conradii]AFC99532.1 tRNA adenylyltransferase (CCA-adding enzyme) [Methanocella conradii HZ254]
MLAEILDEALARVRPSEEEERHMKAVAREVIEKVDAEARKSGLDVYAIHVGSTARGTWLRGKKDIDIFLMFPADTPRERLEEDGLRLAKAISPMHEERYAEHPYVTASYKGLDVDLVPCYRVKDAAHIQSAVDRSPFHNEYVMRHIDGLHDQVRLLKQFTRGAGVYGSELRTQGFSGYLCELLVIKYGSFMGVVQHGANFRPGTIIDIEGLVNGIEHKEPLVVIDPVDPGRNVAAALSEQKLCEFIDACRRFIASPSLDHFFPPPYVPIKKGELEGLLASRGTLLIAVTFKTPDVVEDTLYPQLRKAEASIVRLLERHEFKVYRSGVWSNGRSAVVLEMLVWRLPAIERHMGPPLQEREHSERFREKYPEAYVMGCRYAVDLPRRYENAADLIRDGLKSCGLGKHVAASIAGGFDILLNVDALELGPEFAAYLAQFLHAPRR